MPDQMDPQTMQQLMQMQQMMQQRIQAQQQMKNPMPAIPPGMPMGPPMPPGGQGGFMGAAQANQMNPQGAMPPAGDMPPPGGVPPRMPPPGALSPMPGVQPPAPPPGMPQGGASPMSAPMNGPMGPAQGNPMGGQMGGAGPPMNPQMMMQMIQNLPPQAQQMLMQQLSQSLAQQGRGADNMIGHLTPGELTVPPQVQTPKVLATLNKAFKNKGVAAHQFTAGSPTQSINPQTGLPEYGFFNSGFMKAALPVLGGIAGSMILPGIGTELGATAGGAAGAAGGAAASVAPSLALESIGSGLGTTAGGLLSGQKPTQALLSGVGSGVGGYAMGNLSHGMTAMGNPTGALAQSAGPFNPATAAVAPNAPWAGSGVPIPSGIMAGFDPASKEIMNPNTASLPFLGKVNPYQMMGGAAGSAAGGFLGSALSKQGPTGPQLPPGYGDHFTPGKGSWQDQLGISSYNGPIPNFTGFNPMTNFPASHNFYPTG